MVVVGILEGHPHVPQVKTEVARVRDRPRHAREQGVRIAHATKDAGLIVHHQERCARRVQREDGGHEILLERPMYVTS